jgi:hypothetical protein
MFKVAKRSNLSMASQGDVVVANGEFKHYEGHTTVYVVLACFLASFSGLMFGYDIGITGDYFSQLTHMFGVQYVTFFFWRFEVIP